MHTNRQANTLTSSTVDTTSRINKMKSQLQSHVENIQDFSEKSEILQNIHTSANEEMQIIDELLPYESEDIIDEIDNLYNKLAH